MSAPTTSSPWDPVSTLDEFPSPFDCSGKLPTTLVELRIRWFSGAIREKPQWSDKVLKHDITNKWRDEIIEQDAAMFDKLWGGDELYREIVEKQWPRQKISKHQLDYLFQELQYLATQRIPETGIQSTAIPAVFQSLSLISPQLRDQLRNAVSLLENAPPEELDWHPGSNGQVLDLVHPSLYCYRIGHSLSRGLPVGSDTPFQILSAVEYASQYQLLDYRVLSMCSEQHQWLPTDFDVSPDGAVRPVSYIHNVHPLEQRALYAPLCAVLARFVPLFEDVLTAVLHDRDRKPIVEVDPFTWYDGVENTRPSDSDEEEDPEAYYAKVEEWEEKTRWPEVPDPAPFAPPAPPADEGRVRLRGTRIQVVVKLANIILTPEKPRYEGGTWHVEGMANERIVATGIYYYQSENVAESKLAFRQSLGGENRGVDWPHEQGDWRGYGVVFGVYQELNQVLGDVLTSEGKCLAFPNIYQHCVQPFELADKTRPGVRKILAFFLADPTERVLGTGTVPPLQKEWYLEEVKHIPRMQALPQELWDYIMDMALDGTMSREEAEEERKKLMEERGSSVKTLNKDLFARDFNMCEH
ncbi:hypothetical protein GSI_00284 [Ganoderma sinense ZZ0214-1]|uniref:Uncharacterized protein n=1 Tax=Ganoderma sinense ZZ0214-1 TaxID=1077348 RepID=A0A2G8SS49_9APHY|nr:hypothetical protein GSI_00284 [Ganoderma sinense ZZ0214-1]